jgi:hypothetical protein
MNSQIFETTCILVVSCTADSVVETHEEATQTATSVALPSDTPAPTATIAIALNATPDKKAGSATIVINSVIGVGDITQERVFISRTGPGELNMAGWQLRDENGNVFSFPQLQLFEGGAINVWTTKGSASVVDLYWGLQNPVWQPGEKVTIIDAQGTVRVTFQIP